MKIQVLSHIFSPQIFLSLPLPFTPTISDFYRSKTKSSILFCSKIPQPSPSATPHHIGWPNLTSSKTTPHRISRLHLSFNRPLITAWLHLTTLATQWIFNFKTCMLITNYPYAQNLDLVICAMSLFFVYSFSILFRFELCYNPFAFLP